MDGGKGQPLGDNLEIAALSMADVRRRRWNQAKSLHSNIQKGKPDLRLPDNMVKAAFVERLNRFAMLADVNGRRVLCHVANSGRLRELLSPANTLWLSAAPLPTNPKATKRKTTHDLRLVDVGGVLVSADARLPNHLLREAIESGRLPEFAGFDQVRSEVTHGDSRLDLLLTGGSSTCLVEAKSVTLVSPIGDERGERVALFPDAPTSRGRKHVLNLCNAVKEGYRAAVVFVVQRPDADVLVPNVASDPDFYEALVEANVHGVEIYAYRCRVSLKEVAITDRIPVRLDGLG